MVFVVIPVHNRKEFTRKCIRCLYEQTVEKLTIIVVDDGSTDGTSEMIQTEFDRVVLLKGDGELWWAESTNTGIRYAMQHKQDNEENFILTLNDDTEVNPDYVETLLNIYSHNKPCIVGSVCVDIKQPNRLEYAGAKINLYLSGEVYLASKYNFDYRELFLKEKAVESDSLPGRGVLIPFEVFERIGLYDAKRYKQYMADVEFTVRAKKAGYQLFVSVASVVYGHISATGLQITSSLSFSKFLEGLTSTRSPINLALRYRFAVQHAPTKWLYFVLDVGRILTGYVMRRLYLMSH